MEQDQGLGLTREHRERLTREILNLQERFFAPATNGNQQPDLSAVTSHWVELAQSAPAKSYP
jgi:hypothetical protein